MNHQAPHTTPPAEPAASRGRSFERYAVLPGFVMMWVVIVVYVGIGLAIAWPIAALAGWRLPSVGYLLVALPPVATLVGLGAVLPTRSHVLHDQSRNAEREAALVAEAGRQAFQAKLHTALEGSDTENEALDVVERALAIALPEGRVELLLADSSRAHLRRVTSSAADGGCSVESPWSCQAVRRGQTVVYERDDALDACPKLRNRTPEGCSAVCVPMTIMGKAMGVMHAWAPRDEPPGADAITRLEDVVTQSGSRIALLRAIETTQLQAATDPLTGLANRRRLEDRVRQLRRSGLTYAIAIADLDHFKRLNDTFGHDSGDRALRHFAHVMTTALRPDDLVCRYGGEEFVIVFPDASAGDAVAAIRRAAAELETSLRGADVPAFTASFGITDVTASSELDVLLRTADMALFEAKRQGRDRAVVRLDPSTPAEAAEAAEATEATEATAPGVRPSV